MKKSYLFGVLISLVLLFFVFRKVDFAKILIALKDINYFWVVVFILINFLNICIKSYRWKTLFPDFKKTPVIRFLHFFIIGIMTNNILPFRMGEVVRGYLIADKLGVSKTASIGTVVTERAFDVLSLLVLFFIFLMTNYGAFVPTALRHSIIVMLIVFMAIFLFMIFATRQRHIIVNLINKLEFLYPARLKNSIHEKIHFFLDGLGTLKHNKHILRLLSFSIFIWLIEGVSYYTIGVAMHIPVGLIGFMFIMMAICMGAMLPSAPAYLGVYEAACVGAFLVLGIDQNKGLAYAIVIHALQIIIVTVAGVIFIMKEGFSFKDIKKIESETEKKK
jgi:glycosyltransferase 2 family protein